MVLSSKYRELKYLKLYGALTCTVVKTEGSRTIGLVLILYYV